jgi:hypothetical protein
VVSGSLGSYRHRPLLAVSGSLEVIEAQTFAFWVSDSLEVIQRLTLICGGWFSGGHTGTDNRFLKFTFRKTSSYINSNYKTSSYQTSSNMMSRIQIVQDTKLNLFCFVNWTISNMDV